MKNYFSSKCHKCESKSDVNYGHYSYCSKHYREIGMRSQAKSKGKTVPSKEQMEELICSVGDMGCPVCKIKMNWLARDGKKTCITLQHNRDGSFALICFSCNVKHQFMPGDSFYDLNPGYKFCQMCKTEKMISEFFADKRLSCGKKSYCKICANKKTYKWRASVNYKGHNWSVYANA